MDCESMDCKKFCRELVFQHYDDEMGQEQVAAYQQHVKECPHCAKKAHFRIQILTIVRRRLAPRQPAPSRLRDRIRIIIR